MTVGMSGTLSPAQTTLNTVKYSPVASTDQKLRADFSLPQAETVLPQVDPVISVDVFASEVPIGKDKVKFAPAEMVPNYRCAVLLLADKTLGRRLWRAARETLSRLSIGAEKTPFKFELATISAGNLDVLAPMDSKRNTIDQAIQNLNFNGSSPELFSGMKRGIEALSGVAADRKYIVLVSSGISNDQVTSQNDVIGAAREANIRLCTIGFPGSSESAEAVQKLEPLAEQTGGYAVRADGRDLHLPASTEDDVLRYMVSGGLVEVDLAGLKSPVTLDFKVRTQFNRTYEFVHKVDNLPVAPAPVTLAQGSNASPVANHLAKPSLDVVQGWISSHFVLSLVVALVTIAVLAFVLGRFLQKGRKRAVLPDQIVVQEHEAESIPRIFAWLETLDSDQTRYPITKSAVRIGRQADNDIIMKNDTVSGHHAEIVRRGSHFIIAELESSNSVLVSGKRVDKAALQHGDVVELGEVRLRFIDQSST